MPGAPDTLPVRVLKTVSNLVSPRPGPTGCLGPATPAGGPFWAVEVGAKLGSHGFVAGPPRLTVQLDHGVGPGCSGLRGWRGRRGAQGAVGLMSDSVRPHGWKLTRLPCPQDSPGKNTGVGCHFLL